ncbi:hypothetical protein GJV85_12240 [Sulfurimonas aquatica]|uniref:Uncharacterized protein n=1 Tax=Sulfurimonas aquatica TaxID=2672570 RepID=A0A975GDM7_9BACT|nr:hypothetical protein [Sulfurimonas aquatica]QSZ42845.1 hypothetical protein GJV85_12240 [Sulfurimonas aquatica]
MKEITLKYQAILVPTEAEQQDVSAIYSDDSVDPTPFATFIEYAEDSHDEYINPTERLNEIKRMRDLTPAIDYEMDSLLKTLNGNVFQINQVLADSYESYSEIEKSAFDIINRLENELETRRFLPLAIESATTSMDYCRCLMLANDLFDEQEVVYQLYKNSIKLLTHNVGTVNECLNIYIEKTNFSEIQKLELKIRLQNKVKSLK